MNKTELVKSVSAQAGLSDHKSEWISVEDRLPEIGTRVLLCGNTKVKALSPIAPLVILTA